MNGCYPTKEARAGKLGTCCPNKAPVAKAGADQSIQLPKNYVTLDGK